MIGASNGWKRKSVKMRTSIFFFYEKQQNKRHHITMHGWQMLFIRSHGAWSRLNSLIRFHLLVVIPNWNWIFVYLWKIKSNWTMLIKERNQSAMLSMKKLKHNTKRTHDERWRNGKTVTIATILLSIDLCCKYPLIMCQLFIW